jgi:hypothetical protein
MRTMILALSVCAFALTASAADKVKSEVELQAEPIGINYERLSAAAREGNPEAVRVILALRFDGGGGEMFQADWRPRILRALSDDILADALSDLSRSLRREIVASMITGISGTELEPLKRRFTKSFANPTSK